MQIVFFPLFSIKKHSSLISLLGEDFVCRVLFCELQEQVKTTQKAQNKATNILVYKLLPS